MEDLNSNLHLITYCSEVMESKQLKEENDKQKSLLSDIYKDLLMRSEVDSNGYNVVDLSHHIWIQLKEILEV